jgi:putative transposase
MWCLHSKYRRKVLYGQIRKDLGPVFAELARQKECWIETGHLMSDHVHMLINVPPKDSVSQVVGYIKGKSAIYITRTYGQKMHDFAGEHF